MVKLTTETVDRQRDARELGRAAGRMGANERVQEHVMKKEKMTIHEKEEFRRGYEEGEREAGG